MGKAATKSQQLWQGRVQKWKASGLSAAEFAQRECNRPSSAGWWKSQLLKAERNPAATMSFVRLANDGSVSTSVPSVEVVLPSGLLVRASAGTPEVQVVALVKALLDASGA